MTTPSQKRDLPLGTTGETERLHTIIRRVCYVLLFGLVIEGALTLPLTLVWYGWPTLSVQQVCSGLRQVMYSDPSLHCRESYPLNAPPFGSNSNSRGLNTAKDQWGPQPTPEYPRVGFRQLITIYNHDEQLTHAVAGK